MTTETMGAVPDTRRRAVGSPALAALGWREARRLVSSPVYIAIFGLLAVNGLGAATHLGDLHLPSQKEMYDFIEWPLVLFGGIATYAAAHLVTSSARRSGAEPQLRSLPGGASSRVLGQLLGVLMGPVVVAAVLLAVLGRVGAGLVPEIPGEGPLSVVELGQVALMVLGGGVFGIMVATWLRFPGSLVIGLVLLIFGTVWLGSASLGYADWLPWLTPMTTADYWMDDAAQLVPGSQLWHGVYLAGLCGLAVVAAGLRDRERRTRWVVAGLAVGSVTVLAAAAQT